MILPKIVKVAVDQASFHFDKLYDYTLPDSAGPVSIGCRVIVPFGGGNRRRQGVVMAFGEVPDVSKLKPVYSVVDRTPYTNEEMIALAAWIKERTFCTYFEAIRTMLPTGLYLQVKEIYRALPVPEKQKLGGDELAAWSIAEKSKNGITRENLLNRLGHLSSSDLPERLVRMGALVRSDDALRRVGDATVRMVRLSPEINPSALSDCFSEHKCTPKQQNVLSLLADSGGASVKELCYFCGVTPAVITALEKKSLVLCYDSEVLRRIRSDIPARVSPPATLSPEQQSAYDNMLALYNAGTPAAALLFGVTGSGKTQVYMNLIDHVIKDGRPVIVLVPEIALTPQLLSLFISRFGDKVAMMHSGMAIGERLDEWKRIRRGNASIVIGTRSAIFAPCENIGLIIMDEEQEHTYKSDASPRYHARDIAKWRCSRHKALLLLCSATPSVETFHAAVTGRYSLLALPSRYGAAELPEVEIVDMREQPEGYGQMISQRLKSEIDRTVEDGYQVILLLNRRGYNTFVSCRSCGHIITCPHCSISMTYHRANDRLMCHYCGHSQRTLTVCPDCGSDKVRYSGLGTQRAETELAELFPDARILRMDADTTMSKSAYENKFGEFARGEYNMMIGTQMVAKGLDFPGVRLVGVLSADQSLYGDDYRCFETTFSLLTQVIGRAGRRDSGGKAIIQTFTPDNYVIELASVQDYKSFYETEIEARRLMKYPPYTDLCMFGFVGADEENVRESANIFLNMLKQSATGKYAGIPMIVLDPSPAAASRVAGKYRYKLLVKTRADNRMRQMVSELIIEFSRVASAKKVTIFSDINPSGII